MTATQASPVLIIGAGIAGLTLGRLLTNAGVDNIVFEASEPDRQQGYSISLRDWGYEALLGALGDTSIATLLKAVAPDRRIGGAGWLDQVLRDNSTGQTLVAPDSAQLQGIVRASRNALRDWLADHGDEPVDVRYRHSLQRIEGQPGNVRVQFTNGARYTGSILVAADGVHSAVRSQILPHIVPEVVSAVVYHGEFNLTHAEFNHLVKPLMGNSNILAGVGDGYNTPITICNVTKTHYHLDWSYSRSVRGTEDPLYRPNCTIEEAKQMPPALLHELASLDLAEPWATILSPESIQRHSVFHWTSRSVFMPLTGAEEAEKYGIVFVGDSWHAMPIFGGEGGNHAMLDAIELAAAMSASRGDLAAAATTYYAGAARRCEDAVKRSRQRFFILHRPIVEWRELAGKRSRGQS